MKTSKKRQPAYRVLIQKLLARTQSSQWCGHATQEALFRQELDLLIEVTIPRQSLRTVIRQLGEIKSTMPGAPRQAMVQETIDALQDELKLR